MKNYNKPTLVVNKFAISNALCADKSIVSEETIVWVPNGVKNGLKNVVSK